MFKSDDFKGIELSLPASIVELPYNSRTNQIDCEHGIIYANSFYRINGSGHYTSDKGRIKNNIVV